MKTVIRITLIILATIHAAFAATYPEKTQTADTPSRTIPARQDETAHSTPRQVSEHERLAWHNGKLLILDDRGTLWETDKHRTHDRHTGKKVPLPRYIIARPVRNHITSINSNDETVFAIDENGTLRGWGKSEKGELLAIRTGKTDIPEKAAVTILTDVKRIITNDSTLFAIKTDHTLWVWGEPDSSLRGDNHYHPLNHPRKILDHVTDAVNSTSHILVLKDDKTLWTWGSNHCGGLGNDYTKESVTRPVPIDMSPFQGKRIISMGAYQNENHALTEDNRLWYWGNSSFAQPVCFDEAFYEPTAISVSPAPRLTRLSYDFADGYISLLAYGKNDAVYSLQHVRNTQKKTLKRLHSQVRQYLGKGDTRTVMYKDGTVWIQNDPDNNTRRAQVLFIPPEQTGKTP